MEQIYNPYLPLYEHIPDGEPHVFGDRLYIYGSHDLACGKSFCEDNYAVWSAPVDDLRDWRYEGVSYLRTQDPSNANDIYQLWAPDAAQGKDGRYYLYYCLSGMQEIGVAVSDKPAGPFAFYGHVHYADGRTLTEHFPFDPAVLVDDDGQIYLYYGQVIGGHDPRSGGFSSVVKLADDMLTANEEPRPLIPGEEKAKGTSFEKHPFFEASSIRKDGDRYYFIYSSLLSHELCYATSSRPDGDFTFGGTLISNGDIGYEGRTKPVQRIGNTHGSIVKVKDQWYVFYHRQTGSNQFSRQGCAEPIEIKEDGSIPQVEMTSCGLNGSPLIATGSYPAAIACHLTDRHMPSEATLDENLMKDLAQVTMRQNVTFITNIKDRTKIGYKYFNFMDADIMTIELRGKFFGKILVAHDEEGRQKIAEYEVQVNTSEWDTQILPIKPMSGKHALYFYFKGQGTLDMKGFAFVSA